MSRRTVTPAKYPPVRHLERFADGRGDPGSLRATPERLLDVDGEHFSREDVYIRPRPYQDPRPPLRMPAESEKSIQFAVEKRVPIGRVFVDTDGLATTFGRYCELAGEGGWTPNASHFDAARTVFIAEDMETAREGAEEPLR